MHGQEGHFRAQSIHAPTVHRSRKSWRPCFNGGITSLRRAMQSIGRHLFACRVRQPTGAPSIVLVPATQEQRQKKPWIGYDQRAAGRMGEAENQKQSLANKEQQAADPQCAPTPVETAPMEAGKEEAAVRVVKLRAVEATPESFAPFGQVVAGGTDGAKYGPDDAQLDLSRGIPRFYLMRLENQPLKFSSITHHANVTQCLGSIGGQDWYLGVAKPSLVESGQDGIGRKSVQSRAGHYYLPPDPAEVYVFRVSGLKFLKLHRGTWHAGPLFKADAMDFYNLELSNTNIVDHTTHHFKKHHGVTFVVED